MKKRITFLTLCAFAFPGAAIDEHSPDRMPTNLLPPLARPTDLATLAKSLRSILFCNTKSLSIRRRDANITVSPKFQVVIPKDMRESLKLFQDRRCRRCSTRTALNSFRCGQLRK